jgi:hypothetical protein
VSIDALPAEIVSAYCDLLFRCDVGTSDDAIAARLILRDSATCAEYLERAFLSDTQIGALQQAVEAGTVAYDAAAAGRCLDSLRAGCRASVSGAELGGPDCDAAFTGTVAEGGGCYLDEECVDGLGCDFASGTCPGSCATVDTGAFTCGGAVCADGEECFFPETGIERCVTEVLQADAGEGQPCGLVEEGTDTVTRRGCVTGLWCTGDSYQIGTCRAPIAAGASCAGNDRCVAGHVCAGGSCRAVTVVRTPGGPCDETMLQVCDPLLRLECVAGSCTEFTDGRSGSPCRTGDFGEITCNPGLVCHRDTTTCGSPKAAGTPCVADGECASGSCDAMASTCRERYCELD